MEKNNKNMKGMKQFLELKLNFIHLLTKQLYSMVHTCFHYTLKGFGTSKGNRIVFLIFIL